MSNIMMLKLSSVRDYLIRLKYSVDAILRYVSITLIFIIQSVWHKIINNAILFIFLGINIDF